MAKIQQNISTTALKPKTERQQRLLESVGQWAGYYRANPHRFAEDFLHLKLHLFQKILLVMMNITTVFVFVACRGIGKTFFSAIFCVTYCILYPGTKVCIASGTKDQAFKVLEKITTELKPDSPELAYEIDDKLTHLGGENPTIVFKNGSYIKVVAASDNARGNRAHILLIDEFRMVKKDVIDTVLKKFLSNPRHPQYMNEPEYRDDPSLKEPLRTMYLSSAYYKDHWSYAKTKTTCMHMLNDRRKEFVCGFPYQLALMEKLLDEDRVIEDMTESDFNEVKWQMEMCSEFFGDSGGTFFSFEAIAKNRKIAYPMLPERLSGKLPSATKLRIQPKLPGEIRILSADIALMSSGKYKNDATAIFINQLVPTKAARYSSNIVYTDTFEGVHTEDQALTIRKMYEEYNCDYIVLDCKNVGLAIYDVLARDITDPETGEIYPALSCCNNDEMAARCSNKEAAKVIWAVYGSPKFNSECAILLREGFRTGRIRLPVAECDGELALNEIKGFASLPHSDRVELTLVYINTTLLIRELINLQHEESSGFVRISEKSGMRKDRYSSLSYNYWVANQLESKMRKKASYSTDIKETFLFRAPKIK